VRTRARAGRGSGGTATDREIAVVAAVIATGSEKAAARLGLSPSTVKHHLANARSKVGAEMTAQLVWILARRLPEPLEPRLADDRSARGQTVANPDPPEDHNSAPSTSVTTR
jgi:DNA-binding CsgD family transcriptional regulator